MVKYSRSIPLHQQRIGLLAGIITVLVASVACTTPSAVATLATPTATFSPTATPTPTVTPSPTITPTPNPVPTGFKATTLHNGATIHQNTPFDLKGTYASAGSMLVWVVLGDRLGNDFLQSPALIFDEDGPGTWSAHNIRAGSGIIVIHFVWVTSEGNDKFLQMAAAGEFGAFHSLPAGSRVLLNISIQVV